MSAVLPSSVRSDLSPRRIIDAVMNYRVSKVLLVAVSYDLFTWISRGDRTLPALCLRLGTSPRGMDILLEALVSLNFLKKEGRDFVNSDIAETYLVEGSPGYLGNNLKYQEKIWSAWSDLRSAVRNGRPRKGLEDLLTDPSFSMEYIRGMANIAERPAREIADLLGDRPVKSILDVGAGPGAYSAALLEKYPDAVSTLLDLPSTIRIARELLRDRENENRFQFKEGNYHELNFGSAAYDLVLMSHITHDEGEEENRRLVQKAFRALRPGGRIVLHDFMTHEDQPSAPFSALFSVHMLVYTEKGKVYSQQTYQNWLTEAGFDDFQIHEIAKDLQNTSKALIATRPAR